MSDRMHTNEVKHQYWIEDKISEKLDEKIKNTGYKNRSEWYREQIRRFLEKN